MATEAQNNGIVKALPCNKGKSKPWTRLQRPTATNDFQNDYAEFKATTNEVGD